MKRGRFNWLLGFASGSLLRQMKHKENSRPWLQTELKFQSLRVYSPRQTKIAMTKALQPHQAEYTMFSAEEVIFISKLSQRWNIHLKYIWTINSCHLKWYFPEKRRKKLLSSASSPFLAHPEGKESRRRTSLTVTFHPLVQEPVEQRPAMVTEGGAAIGVDLELVLAPGILQGKTDTDSKSSKINWHTFNLSLWIPDFQLCKWCCRKIHFSV